MSKSATIGRFLALVVALGSANGCGNDGPPRTVVTGTVTYDGQPIESGEIRFIPTGETRTPPWGADIIDGKYSCHGRGGVPLGTHRVVIEAFRDAPNAPTVDPDMPSVSEADIQGRQYIPAKYNTQSTLEFTITDDAGPIVKDFHLPK